MKNLLRCLTLAVALFCLIAPCLVLAQDPVPPLPERSFTLVCMPDTQTAVAARPQDLDAQIQWIVRNREPHKIAFVTFVGDIVDKNVPEQWDTADKHISKLDGVVPYGIALGNHDMSGKTGECKLFQERFPQSRFEKQPWYVPGLDNNTCSAQRFEALGQKVLMVHLPCSPTDAMLAWADGILARHADHLAIVTTHMYLGPKTRPEKPEDFFALPKGLMEWKKRSGADANNSPQMWEKCFKKHANLALILCGDQSRTQAHREEQIGDHGNRVHALLSDYGPGFMRLYRLNPSARTVDAVTYNAATNALVLTTKYQPSENQHRFSVTYAK